LYVSDVRFLEQVASPVLVDVQEELDELGDFMLTMAQERAAQAGVQAVTEVRQGVFREALKAAIQAHHISTVILGSAAAGTGLTTAVYLEELSVWIHDQTGAEVFVASEGQIVGQWPRAVKTQADQEE
jgi:hypothetical protein